MMFQSWKQCFSVFFVFFVTLTCFPAIWAGVERSSCDFFIPGELLLFCHFVQKYLYGGCSVISYNAVHKTSAWQQLKTKMLTAFCFCLSCLLPQCRIQLCYLFMINYFFKLIAASHGFMCYLHRFLVLWAINFCCCC